MQPTPPNNILNEPSKKRKYMSEAGINLYSSGANVLRPKELYNIEKSDTLRKALEGCNIYLIVKRKRISICPGALRISNGKLYGDYLVHTDTPFSFERVSFSQSDKFQAHGMKNDYFLDVKTENDFGFNITTINSDNEINNIPANVLIANTDHKLGELCNLEVLYVGQAFGKQGQRLAIDRLKSHTTLQKIMADTMEENPNDEVLLLLFRFEHQKCIMSTAGDYSITPSATTQEEITHSNAVGNINIDRKSRITICEAALINYFKPKYNILHKDSFNIHNAKKLRSLQKLFTMDLSSLFVEIDTENLGSKLYSPHVPAKKDQDIFDTTILEKKNSEKNDNSSSSNNLKKFIKQMTHVHIAQFPLYSQHERETFLHALPWQ